MEENKTLLQQADAFNKKIKASDTKGKKEKKGITASTLKIITMIVLFMQNFNIVIMERLLDTDSMGKSLEPLKGMFEGIYSIQWKLQANMEYLKAVSDFFEQKSTIWTIYLVFTVIGCMTLPLLCYLLVQGFLKSTRRRRDLYEMGAFAIISEIPYDLATSGKVFDYTSQNVFFGLFIGLLVLTVMDYIFIKLKESNFLKYILSVLVVLVGMMICIFGMSFYLCFPVLIMASMYIFNSKKLFGSAVGCFTMTTLSMYYLCSFLALIPIHLYNGKPGRKMGYLLYIFYPLHLLVIYMIAKVLHFY